ncbi:MAG: hypothetical protein HRT64_13670, partial [Erythrobacter sp.]|nr:hypothetical protein [Erythrobacter sp.]
GFERAFERAGIPGQTTGLGSLVSALFARQPVRGPRDALDALIAGVLTFVAAFLTMAFLMNFLKRASMLVFVIYRVAMGAALLYFF